VDDYFGFGWMDGVKPSNLFCASKADGGLGGRGNDRLTNAKQTNKKEDIEF